MNASLPDCEYRVMLDGAESLYFCRHNRVRTSDSLVDPRICRQCLQRTEPCDQPREIPVHPIRISSRSLENENATYISTEQLVADTRELIGQLPADVSGVAGIPRSGMLPASLIAAYLHLPLYELSLSDGLRPIGHGLRLSRSSRPAGPLLVVDDSVYSGYVMRKARARLSVNSALFAALYPRPESSHFVNFYARLARAPHLFEWNLFNCNQTRDFAFDFDGVLCHDWNGGRHEGEAYRDFVKNARPRWLPRRSPISLIVTARLEQHRQATEAWLSRHGVRVKRLVMGPWESVEARRRGNVAEFKGRAFALSKCTLFIESDEQQAAHIHEVAKKPVLCPLAGKVFQ